MVIVKRLVCGVYKFLFIYRYTTIYYYVDNSFPSIDKNKLNFTLPQYGHAAAEVGFNWLEICVVLLDPYELITKLNVTKQQLG